MANIPVNEFDKWDYSDPQTLTCKNHLDKRWYWKGPGRNLHYSWLGGPECPCPMSDLMVMAIEGPLNKDSDYINHP